MSGITDEAVEAAAAAIGDIYGHPPDDYRIDASAALEAALPHMTPMVDREALARAAHHYFCVVPGEATHEPDEIDYDKADEILEILALLNGGAS